MRIRVSMLAILDEAGRKFNADKLDGTGRRDRTGAEMLRHGARAWDLAFPPACVRCLALTANGPPRRVWTVAEIECFQ